LFNTLEVLKKCSEKLGLKRIVYDDKQVPTSMDNVVIFVFFGNTRNLFILSSLLLRRIREETKGSKYFIVLSWPGSECLFDFADEYWTISDQSLLEKLSNGANEFKNDCSNYSFITRGLNEWFYDVMTFKDLEPYYENGFKKDFFEKFKHIKVNLPNISSSASLGMDFARTIGSQPLKLFVYPSKTIDIWKNGRIEKVKISKTFWIELIDLLIKEKYFPIIYKDLFAYDVSGDFTKDCLHVWEPDLQKVLSAMRATGLVLDFFNGISNLAICARTPFICFDERNSYNHRKQQEIDDLCAKDLYKEYIFTFGTIITIEDINHWRHNLFNVLNGKLNKIFPKLSRDNLPSTTESNNIVPYSVVRVNKSKKFGSRFIKIKKD